MNIETANRLLQYRKKYNLSQEELASRIGVSRQAVSKWERAEASPDTDNLILLADIYGVSLDELLKGENQNIEQDNTEASESTDSTDTNVNNESNEIPQPDNNTEYEKVDHVSFKNGIHVDSKDGDHVHISFAKGIHIHDKHGTKVDIDGNGIFVNDGKKQKVYTDENGNVMADKEAREYHKCSKWNMFPYPIVAIILFLVWGFSDMYFGWALSWVSFLTIPLYYSLGSAIRKRNPAHFAFPVLTVIAYMFFGFFNVCGGWALGWIVFLTVPIYYWICNIIKPNSDCTCH